MDIRPYKETIGMKKEDRKAATADARIESFRRKAAKMKAALEEEIANITVEVQNMCMADEPNLEAILDKLDDKALLERRVVRLAALVTQLFPVDEVKV